MLTTMRGPPPEGRAMASVMPPPTTRLHHHPDADARKQNQAFYEFLVPLVKGYSTEMSLEVTSLGCRCTVAWGFNEETGAPRSTTATPRSSPSTKARPPSRPTISWVARPREMAVARREPPRAQVERTEAELLASGTADARQARRPARRARPSSTRWFVAGQTQASPNAVFVGSVPYLMPAGNLVAGWLTGARPAGGRAHGRGGRGCGLRPG